MRRVPTNVVTGFLGVGKTTAVLDLLARKPGRARWAVLVNEYGEVSVDSAILEGGAENVTVRDVTGGCFCCVAAPYLHVALHLLLQDAQPERLIVETTGLGHPGRLLDTLRGPFADRLDVRATLTVVSPDDFTTPGMLENQVFREQVEFADVLVMNKLDRATPAVVDEFQQWANGLYPSKLLVAAMEQGRLEPWWLDLGGGGLPVGVLTHDDPPVQQLVSGPAPIPGRPVRLVSTGPTPAAGWVFAPTDVFDEGRLMVFLSGLPSPRLKGVFHLADEWVMIHRTAGGLTSAPTGYRRDSRVEIFGTAGTDWDAVEAGLLNCLVGRGESSNPDGSGLG